MRYLSITLILVFLPNYLADFAFALEYGEEDRSKSQPASERAKYHLKRKEWHEARSVLEAALHNDPSNPYLYHLLGESWRGLGDNEKAIDAYSQAIQHKTQEPSVFTLRGYLYSKRKDWVHAIKDYTKAIQLDPDVSSNYYRLGIAYFNQRKYAKAREEYERAWKRGLENPTACALAQLLSMCPLASVRDGRLAIKYARIAYEQKQKNNAKCLDLLAAAHAEAGEWDLAVRHCELAIQSANGDFRELLSLCLELYRLHEPYHQGPSQASGDFNASSQWVLSPARNNIGEIMDAIKAASSRKTVEPNPQLADVHLRLGVFFQYSDTVDAILHYNRCIELDPENPLGFVVRSFAYSILGKSQEAMADAKSALSLSPKRRDARCVLAWCLASLGESNKAIREIDKLREEFSDDPILHLQRGHCYVVQGQYDKAIGELTEAIKPNPKLTIAYAERAVALSGLGKKDEAKRDLDECGRSSPSLRELTGARIRALHKGRIRGRREEK